MSSDPQRDLERAHGVPNVSPRQKEILRLIEQGEATEGISEELGIAESTVKTHVKRLAVIFQCRLPDMPARARERGVEF